MPHWFRLPFKSSIADSFKFISGQVSRGYLDNILNALQRWCMFWSLGAADLNVRGG